MNIDCLLLLYISFIRFFKDFVIVVLMPSRVLIHVVKLNECGNECLGFRALMNFSLLISAYDHQHQYISLNFKPQWALAFNSWIFASLESKVVGHRFVCMVYVNFPIWSVEKLKLTSHRSKPNTSFLFSNLRSKC